MNTVKFPVAAMKNSIEYVITDINESALNISSGGTKLLALLVFRFRLGGPGLCVVDPNKIFVKFPVLASNAIPS